jgi:protoporphyrin/coproporphyrin ferrochelatase
MTTGVVLMTYGAPRTRADVASYLARVRGGRVPADELVADMTARYERIGWSPIVERTVAQAEALETELGPAWRVAAGMRFSLPTIGEAVEVLAAAGAERLVGIAMSPQWSPLLMSGYETALVEAASMLRVPPPVSVAREWHREPAFLDALAERTRDALAKIPASGVPVLLTAHSLPKRVYDSEPDYIAQLKETGTLVAERAGLAAGQWQWAYQSAGHTAEEWLRPDLKELFPALAAVGHRHVLVVPVQFLSDHLEVLYDLDVAAADEAAACGLRYHRIEMPNTQPSFIRALAAVARRTAAVLAPA